MKRLGFTLAEVLIVLAIIGVISAMTIPSLMQNTKGKEYQAQLKKTVSVLNQAVLRNVALEGKDFSSASSDPVKEIIVPQLRGTEANTATTGCGSSGYTLADGSVIAFVSSDKACVDVNGSAGPNAKSTSASSPKDTYYVKLKDDVVTCYDNTDYCKDILRK